MYNSKYLLSFFIFILTPSLLFSTMYEDAEDKNTLNWTLLNDYVPGNIKNIHDTKKKSRIIQLSGENTRSAYIFKLTNEKIKTTPILSWEMKYSEDFVIMVELNTSKGKHTLIYTPGNTDSHLQYGLGNSSTLGQWKKHERNLEKDLNNFINNSKVITIKNFVVKGSGLIDNIQTLSPKKPIKTVTSEKKTQPKPKVKHIVKTNNNMPIINLYGQNPVVLQKGEIYVEAGASATDSNGAELVIDISHQIDIFKEGEYSVIYMTTNSKGDSVIDRRRVVVGKVREQKDEKTKDKPSTKKSLVLEKRSEELSAWEKELEAREEELLEQEVVTKETIQKTPLNEPPSNYPKRPGL